MRAGMATSVTDRWRGVVRIWAGSMTACRPQTLRRDQSHAVAAEVPNRVGDLKLNDRRKGAQPERVKAELIQQSSSSLRTWAVDTVWCR